MLRFTMPTCLQKGEACYTYGVTKLYSSSFCRAHKNSPNRRSLVLLPIGHNYFQCLRYNFGLYGVYFAEVLTIYLEVYFTPRINFER